jgi:hypothetical protein
MSQDHKVMSIFETVCDLFGETPKHALLYHLHEKFGISAGSSVSMERLQSGLQNLLGEEAADVIVERMSAEMAKLERFENL